MVEAHRSSEIVAHVAQDSGIAREGRGSSSMELTGGPTLNVADF